MKKCISTVRAQCPAASPALLCWICPEAPRCRPQPCSVGSAGGLPGTASPSQSLPVCLCPPPRGDSRGCWLLHAGFWLLGAGQTGSRCSCCAYREHLRFNIISIGVLWLRRFIHPQLWFPHPEPQAPSETTAELRLPAQYCLLVHFTRDYSWVCGCMHPEVLSPCKRTPTCVVCGWTLPAIAAVQPRLCFTGLLGILLLALCTSWAFLPV